MCKAFSRTDKVVLYQVANRFGSDVASDRRASWVSFTLWICISNIDWPLCPCSKTAWNCWNIFGCCKNAESISFAQRKCVFECCNSAEYLSFVDCYQVFGCCKNAKDLSFAQCYYVFDAVKMQKYLSFAQCLYVFGCCKNAKYLSIANSMK